MRYDHLPLKSVHALTYSGFFRHAHTFPANVQLFLHNECEVLPCADFGFVLQTQWSMRLEGEEVKVVALGTAWVAAITSFNFLRIFTEGGLQVCQRNIINILLHPFLGWGGEGGGGLKLLVFELWIMIYAFIL